MLKSCLTLTQIVLSDFEQQILKKVQNTSKMIRFSRDMYTNTMNKSFPVGIMKSKLIRCSGVALQRSALMRSCWRPSAQPCWKWSRTPKGVSLGCRGQSSRRLSARQIPPVLSHCNCTTLRSILGGFSVWFCGCVASGAGSGVDGGV